MAIDYCNPYRFDLVLAKCTDGGGDQEGLLKAVENSE